MNILPCNGSLEVKSIWNLLWRY